MISSTTFSYRDESKFHIKTLIEAVRFIVINTILALIFLFLTLEEIEWTLLSSKKSVNDKIIDNTSWNIREIFEVY